MSRGICSNQWCRHLYGRTSDQCWRNQLNLEGKRTSFNTALELVSKFMCRSHYHALYNTIQYNTIQYNTIQRNATQRNATQRNATQRNGMEWNGMKWNAIQYNKYHNAALYTYSLHSVEFYSILLLSFSVELKRMQSRQWVYNDALWYLCKPFINRDIF